MKELQELLLPQIIELRRNESVSGSDEASSRSTARTARHRAERLSLASISSSDTPSPTVPARHPKRGSGTPINLPCSSLPSSPSLRNSSDTFTNATRATLDDVKEEEPVEHVDQDADYDMVDYSATRSRSSEEHDVERAPYLSPMDWTLDDNEAIQYMEYNLRNETLTRGEFALNPIAKRQRAETLSGLASKMGSRMPSLSRKWKSRKASPSVPGAGPALSRASSLSRADSSRAPSFTNATVESLSRVPGHGHEHGHPHPQISVAHHNQYNLYNKNHPACQLPPTPTRSVHNDGLNGSWTSVDDMQLNHSTNSTEMEAGDGNDNEDARDHRQHGDDEDEDQAKPTTPLLPPIMTDIPDAQELRPSPLQSPSVADPESMTPSAFHTPVPTPQIHSLPSPPLSSKPSNASFHHFRQHPLSSSTATNGNGNGTAITSNAALIPTSDVPLMALNNVGPTAMSPTNNPNASNTAFASGDGEAIHLTNDKWSEALGHCNFHIQPEPYVPAIIDLTSCKKLRGDWEIAQQQYAKHLASVIETAGPTSEIHSLTEQKWDEINRDWKRKIDLCVALLHERQQQSPTSTLISTLPPTLTSMPNAPSPTFNQNQNHHGASPILHHDGQGQGQVQAIFKSNTTDTQEPVVPRPAPLVHSMTTPVLTSHNPQPHHLHHHHHQSVRHFEGLNHGVEEAIAHDPSRQSNDGTAITSPSHTPRISSVRGSPPVRYSNPVAPCSTPVQIQGGAFQSPQSPQSHSSPRLPTTESISIPISFDAAILRNHLNSVNSRNTLTKTTNPPQLIKANTAPIKIPTLNAPGSEGKFPCVGEEGIVGPMERAPTPTPPATEADNYLHGQGAGHGLGTGRRKRKFSVLIRDWLLGVRGH